MKKYPRNHDLCDVQIRKCKAVTKADIGFCGFITITKVMCGVSDNLHDSKYMLFFHLCVNIIIRINKLQNVKLHRNESEILLQTITVKKGNSVYGVYGV